MKLRLNGATKQDGLRNDRRLRCFRDIEKKTYSILRHTATAEKTEVQEKLAETSDNRPRRKRKVKDLDPAVTAATRAEYLQSILALPLITDSFPRLDDLLKLYRRGVKAGLQAQLTEQAAGEGEEVEDEGEDEASD